MRARGPAAAPAAAARPAPLRGLRRLRFPLGQVASTGPFATFPTRRPSRRCRRFRFTRAGAAGPRRGEDGEKAADAEAPRDARAAVTLRPPPSPTRLSGPRGPRCPIHAALKPPWLGPLPLRAGGGPPGRRAEARAGGGGAGRRTGSPEPGPALGSARLAAGALVASGAPWTGCPVGRWGPPAFYCWRPAGWGRRPGARPRPRLRPPRRPRPRRPELPAARRTPARRAAASGGLKSWAGWTATSWRP